MQAEKVEKPVEENANTEGHKKDKKREKKPPIKHERPAEYERNAQLITPDTQLEPLLKKNELLAKPELKEHQEKESKNREKITKLIQKKKQIRSQKYKSTKNVVKGEGDKHDDFKVEVDEFKTIKDRFMEVRNERNVKRQELTKLIQQAKANHALLKELHQASKSSKQSVEEKLERLEHRLLTADLSKNQQKQLNNDIMLTKRKLRDAESVGNIEVRIAKAEQRKAELDQDIEKIKADKDPLEQQYRQLKGEMDKKNQVINQLKGVIKNQTDAKTETRQKHNKQYEDWKQSKGKRLDEIQVKIKEIDAENKKIWEEYHEKMDKYWAQKHKVDFLEWQHRIKKRKGEEAQREKRRAFGIEKDKQREKQEQLKKYIKEIQLCNFLVSYLNQTNQKPEKTEQVAKHPDLTDDEIKAKLKQNSQWKKQKGLEVLASKKSKQDESPVKKGKKNKKKKEENAEEKSNKFEIPLNVQVMFDNLKLLPPTSAEQVPKKIEELKDREKLFQRACSQDVNQDDQKTIENIKGTNKTNKKQNKQNGDKKTEEQFPTL